MSSWFEADFKRSWSYLGLIKNESWLIFDQKEKMIMLGGITWSQVIDTGSPGPSCFLICISTYNDNDVMLRIACCLHQLTEIVCLEFWCWNIYKMRF